jgi:hypothetical protein
MAKRKLNERDRSLGDGFVCVAGVSIMVLFSIEPVPTREEFNRNESLGTVPGPRC